MTMLQVAKHRCRAGLGGYSALAALQGMAAPAPVPPANGFAALQVRGT